MLNRLRSRLTYANVVATLALFLVLSGGTALASFVVTSNSQVAQNTISGHKPPTGDHPNIIGGSVNGTDLANSAVSAGKLGANSVNSSKVINGSLLGADIGSNTITGSNLNLTNVSTALQLRSERATMGVGATPTAFYNTGAFTLTGSCPATGANTFQARIELSSPSPAFASIDDAAGERFTGTASNPVAQTADATLASTAVRGGEFSAASLQFTNHLSGHVLAVAEGEDSEAGLCQFTFEGLGS